MRNPNESLHRFKRFELPGHFIEAEEYYKELRKNPDWLKANMGRTLAIIGREVVDQIDRNEEFGTLSKRVREEYGRGPIFMPKVTNKYPPVATLSPTAFIK